MRTVVLYYNTDFPMRRTGSDALKSFHRYLPGDVVYVNLAHRQQARATRSARMAATTDVLVFETSVLSLRWDLARFEERMDQIAHVATWDAVKLAFPQDEFFRTVFLEDQLERFGVSHVFSVAPASEWPKIYPRLSTSSVEFHQVLTGYLDDHLVEEMRRSRDRHADRPIAIGYRAWRAEPWLGRLGQLKVKVSDAFAPYDRPGFRVDVSTRREDTFLGAAWIRFLRRCQAIPGCGSGATILDADGSLRLRTHEYLAAHPSASYEEVERECFPGRDGELALNVIGPRHLEACLTRTCQILVPADYSGVLQQGAHYVPLAADLSNIDACIDAVRDQQARAEIVERAYADVVEGGRWSYRHFIEDSVAPVVRDVGTSKVGVRTKVSDASLSMQRRVRDAGFGILTTVPRWTARALRFVHIPVTEDRIIQFARTALGPLRRS